MNPTDRVGGWQAVDASMRGEREVVMNLLQLDFGSRWMHPFWMYPSAGDR